MVLFHTTGDQVGLNYSVEWDKSKNAQRWSCYQIHAATNKKATSRYSPKNGEAQYPFDPVLGQNNYFGGTDPYWGSGYDHGHICPSADRLYSSLANLQTFYLTNMQPQKNLFNAGVWAHMEDFMRSKIGTKAGDTIFICKGGTIDNESQIAGRTASGLIVPKYFFMAALRKKSADWSNASAIGFFIEHRGADNDHPSGIDNYKRTDAGNKYDLSEYVVNIRELEGLTGIDFFCNVPDDVEEKLETQTTDLLKQVWSPLVSSNLTISY